MNAKNKKIIMILVFALVISVVFAVGLYSYLNPQRTTIYLFNGRYEAGTELTEEMIYPVQVDSRILRSNNPEDISTAFITEGEKAEVLRSGDALRIDVSEGLPLTRAVLSVGGGSNVEMQMSKESVAVTVPVTETTAVTNDLTPGSRVNIYTIRNDAVVLILQNMQIISVNRDEASGEITGATVQCNVDQSLKLVYASSNSTVYFGMVSSSGYEAITGEDPSYKPEVQEAK